MTLGKRYHDDDEIITVESAGAVHKATFRAVVHWCYRRPDLFGQQLLAHRTIAHAIEHLTGHPAVRDTFTWPGASCSLDRIRPAHINDRGGAYYYIEDFEEITPTCESCGKHLSLTELSDHLWRVKGGPCCRDMLFPTRNGSPAQNRIFDLYREHFTAVACSAACHHTIAVKAHRAITHIKELHTWLRTGRASQAELRAVLDGLGQKASRSRQRGSTPRATSAT